jgi:hypothetical protein
MLSVIIGYDFESKSPKDGSAQLLFKLAPWFLKRRFVY